MRRRAAGRYAPANSLANGRLGSGHFSLPVFLRDARIARRRCCQKQAARKQARKGNAMNCLIVCFSATGNTRHGCRLIRDGIRSAGGRCEVVSSREFGPEQLAGCDLLGFAGPVFAYKPALPLLELISRLPAGEGRPCFTFLTYGGMEVNAARILQTRLRAKGYPVIARYSAAYEDSWTAIRFRGWRPGAGRPDQQTRQATIEFGRSLVAVWNRFVAEGSLWACRRSASILYTWFLIFITLLCCDGFSRLWLIRKNVLAAACV